MSLMFFVPFWSVLGGSVVDCLTEVGSLLSRKCRVSEKITKVSWFSKVYLELQQWI